MRKDENDERATGKISGRFGGRFENRERKMKQPIRLRELIRELAYSSDARVFERSLGRSWSRRTVDDAVARYINELSSLYSMPRLNVPVKCIIN